MAVMTKSDFYFGGLLSVMLNEGVYPALIENYEKRRIYTFSTNKADYQLYVKYVESPTSSSNEARKLWNFPFSDEEIDKITKYNDENEKKVFGLICGVEGLKDSEIVIMNFDDVKDCLGIGRHEKGSKRISVRYVKNGKGLWAYGTGRDRSNAINILRDEIKKF